MIAPAPANATVVPVSAPRPAQRVPRRFAVSKRVIATLVIAAAMLVGGSAWGYTTYQDLTATRAALQSTQANLASTNDDLDKTKGTLRSTSDQLQNTMSSLAKEQEARAAADRQVAGLQRQVTAQVACIQSLTADREQLQRIQGLIIDNYNRRARGSVWAAASAARDTAIANALDDYYQAYSSAFDGFKALANSYIALGNTQRSNASAQLSIMNSQIDAMNAANSQIDSAFAAFAAELRNTNATCGF